MMKWLIISIITFMGLSSGLLLRITVKRHPEAELKVWSILMFVLIIFFFYSLTLIIFQDTPLFTLHHMANECFAISFALFIITGIINIRRIIRKH